MDSNALSPLSPQAAIRALTNDGAGAFNRAAQDAAPMQTRIAPPPVEAVAAGKATLVDNRELQESFNRLVDAAASLDRPISLAKASDEPGAQVAVRDGESGKLLREVDQAEIQALSERLVRFQEVAGLFVDEKA